MAENLFQWSLFSQYLHTYISVSILELLNVCYTLLEFGISSLGYLLDPNNKCHNLVDMVIYPYSISITSSARSSRNLLST